MIQTYELGFYETHMDWATQEMQIGPITNNVQNNYRKYQLLNEYSVSRNLISFFNWEQNKMTIDIVTKSTLG